MRNLASVKFLERYDTENDRRIYRKQMIAFKKTNKNLFKKLKAHRISSLYYYEEEQKDNSIIGTWYTDESIAIEPVVKATKTVKATVNNDQFNNITFM